LKREREVPKDFDLFSQEGRTDGPTELAESFI
jgi:hypothetical protein